MSTARVNNSDLMAPPVVADHPAAGADRWRDLRALSSAIGAFICARINSSAPI